MAYFGAFLLIDFITSSVAFSLERRHAAHKGDGWLLFHIWLQRFAYRQVFSIVLFKTLKRAIDGKPFNWDKLERTAKMSKATDALTALLAHCDALYGITIGDDAVSRVISLRLEEARELVDPARAQA